MNLNPFSTKIKFNLTTCILEFLNYDELYKAGKINKFFFSVYKEMIILREKKFEELKSQYKIGNQGKIVFFKSMKNKELIPLKDNPGEYLRIEKSKITHYVLSTFTHWEWKEDRRYWNEYLVKNPIVPDIKTPFLYTVCYTDCHFCFHHIKKGNYSLFLRQSFTKLNPDKFILTIFVGKNAIYKDEHFPSQLLIDSAKSDSPYDANLENQEICSVKETDFTENKDEYEITVRFDNIDYWWKGGWLIDGAQLIFDNIYYK